MADIAPFKMHNTKVGWVITLDGASIGDAIPDQVTALRALTALNRDGRRHPAVVGRILSDVTAAPF